MGAKVMPGADWEFEGPRQVLAAGIPSPVRGTSFDSARDGRLIMSNANAAAPNSTNRSTVVIVLNWFEVVERRAPKR